MMISLTHMHAIKLLMSVQGFKEVKCDEQEHMASADNTSGPAPQRKEKCMIQCALSSKEEKSSVEFVDKRGRHRRNSDIWDLIDFGVRGEAVEASKRRRSLLDHKIQQLSKGSSEGSVHNVSNDEENKAIRITRLLDDLRVTAAKFNSIKDAKSLLQAVEKRFGGNAATKKTQKNLLKNKPEIDTLSMDDLYNTLKIYEPEVKGTSSSSTNIQNIAFVSSNSTSSTNGAFNTVHGATTASTQATAINLTIIDNLSDDVICAFFASQPNSP
ncbi:hypothetical protein Tco_0268080 [Tanacetum coccineum]